MPGSLKKRALENAGYIIVGQGVNQFIRLVGNLVLTRLLAPELFGLMAITSVVMSALSLFSDIGTGAGVIRSSHGLEPRFLNTAWTLQVMRGTALWVLTILVAYPAAQLYGHPILAYILPVSGLGLLLSGFNSMALVKMGKNLRMGKVIVMYTSAYILGLLCMVALAYSYRNIWALVLGGLVPPLIQLVWSYTLDRSIRHRFMLDQSVRTELLHFGKWIFLSTAMMFLATQADRMLLGKLFPIALFGVYNIAVTLAEAPKTLVNAISGQVIFPLIAMHKELPLAELRHKILQKRKLLLVPLAFLVALFSGFGDLLITLLYDARYQEAGWILPILALGMWPLILYATMERCLYVVENPKYPALGNALKFVYMITCLPLAYMLAGKFGAVLAVAFNDIPPYLVVNYGLRRKQLSGLRQDAWATLLLFALLSGILFFRHFAELGMPGQTAFTVSH